MDYYYHQSHDFEKLNRDYLYFAVFAVTRFKAAAKTVNTPERRCHQVS